MLYFFFFQAEDGIRDIGVTGVQTCALPISIVAAVAAAQEAVLRDDPQALRHILDEVAAVLRTVSRRSLPLIDPRPLRDRKSVVEGKSVDLGGRRIIKKTKTRLV